MMSMTRVMPELCESVDMGGGGGGGVELESVIADSIAGEAGAEPVAAPDPPVDDAAAAEERELAALEQEIRTKNPAMKGNMAIHRHQAVLTRARNQHTAALEALQKERDEHKGWREKFKWAEDPQISEALQVLALAEQDQGKFVDLLLQDDRFSKLITRREAEAAKAAAAAPAGAPASQRPGPNATTADGQFQYYDDKGLEELLKWHGASVKDEALKAAQASWQEQFGPVLSEFQARSTWNDALNSQKLVLDRAREKWAGFKDHEPAIKKFMLQPGNERLSLDDAYREVVIGQFQTATKVNEAELRKKIIEEMRGKPKAVSERPGPGPERVASSGARDLEDVIRASLPRE